MYLKEVQWCFTKVLRVFEVSRVFQGSFKDVSRKFQGSFNGVSMLLQGSFNEVSWGFPKFSRVFQGNLKGISRKFLSVSRNIQVNFKNVSRCKGVSRVFERSLNGVYGKSQWCFKGVSMKS